MHEAMHESIRFIEFIRAFTMRIAEALRGSRKNGVDYTGVVSLIDWPELKYFVRS